MDIETRYNQALDYLYSFVDYSLKRSSELARADFSLDRMFALMEALGNPQAAYPVIHVAGTKGKGSTSALCAAALRAGGYQVGLYTSPHLEDFAERIRINGEPISHERLVDLVEEVKPQVAKIKKLTTFELTTALGFLAFAQYGVNAAVIEVGLGGRLDATNVVVPQVSVITSLSYDHTAVLGDTLTQIAAEKGGIIKAGVPLVSAPQKEEARIALERIARERNSRVVWVGKDLRFGRIASTLEGQTLWVGCEQEIDAKLELQIPLLGKHQAENAAVAYAALKASEIPLADDAIQNGFSQARWRARFEIARRDPFVIFDSAHNQDSFERLREALDEYFPSAKVYLVFGASEDKNVAQMLATLQPKVRKIIAARADHPRALSAERICELANQAGAESEAAVSVKAALKRALELAAKDGSIVLSAGSMFVTAEAMRDFASLQTLATVKELR